MTVNPAIFRAYDIRGLYPGEITPELARAIGRGFAQLFLPRAAGRTVVVGRDARPSSLELFEAVIEGLREGGADVISIGLAPTPLFYFAVNVAPAAGGIMVTASHIAGEWNGFKVVREKAIAMGVDSGLGELRDLIVRGPLPPNKRRGAMREEDFRERYLGFLVRDVRVRKFSVAADTGNGMVGLLLPSLAERLGVLLRGLYLELDGTFPNHEANPLKEETLGDLQRLLGLERFDFGVAFDGDGDRIRFLLPDGRLVPGDVLLAFLAAEYLSRQPGATIVHSVNCSRIVAETILARGGRPVRWKVGHTLMKQKMREVDALLGGELSMHYFYREMFNVDSALLTLARVSQFLTESGKTLEEALRPFFKYAKTAEINFLVSDKQAKIEELSRRYADARQDRLDGLTVAYDAWWFNVRPSNTEPFLRLVVEAENPALLREKVTQISAVIERAA